MCAPTLLYTLLHQRRPSPRTTNLDQTSSVFFAREQHTQQCILRQARERGNKNAVTCIIFFAVSSSRHKSREQKIVLPCCVCLDLSCPPGEDRDDRAESAQPIHSRRNYVDSLYTLRRELLCARKTFFAKPDSYLNIGNTSFSTRSLRYFKERLPNLRRQHFLALSSSSSDLAHPHCSRWMTSLSLSRFLNALTVYSMLYMYPVVSYLAEAMPHTRILSLSLSPSLSLSHTSAAKRNQPRKISSFSKRERDA